MAARRLMTEKNTDNLLKSMLVISRTINHVLETRAIEVTGEPLTYSKIQILRLLGQRGEQSSSQLARFLGVSKPAITQIVTGIHGHQSTQDDGPNQRFAVRQNGGLLQIISRIDFY